MAKSIEFITFLLNPTIFGIEFLSLTITNVSFFSDSLLTKLTFIVFSKINHFNIC